MEAVRLLFRQVARATTAAPTYFNSITIENRKFGDSGFGTNNPVDEVFREVKFMHGNDPSSVGLLVSIGTGMSPTSRFGDGRLGKYVTYVKAAKQLAVGAETIHIEMKDKADSYSPKIPYYRFKTKKLKSLGDMKLDEWKPPSRLSRRTENETLRDITIETEAYLSQEDVLKDLLKTAEMLVNNRRARSNTRQWTLASMGTPYRCTFKGCPSLKSQKMRPHVDNLKNHLRKAHLVPDAELDAYIKEGKCPY
jgi:hypothetical protein